MTARDKTGIASLVAFVLIMSVAAGIAQWNVERLHAQSAQTLQGVTLRPNGVYVIDRTLELLPDFDAPPGSTPTPRLLPTRIVLGESLEDGLTVCRERQDGTTLCQTIGTLFGDKP